jgi:tetrahydromethanopterin S-methyltransferase subunit A
MSVDNKQYNTEREENMADQTLPEIEAVQMENKARKRQKDNYNKAIEAISRLDQEHMEKIAEDIEELYEQRYGEDKKDTSYKIL